jgi:hypothetical protein
VASRHGSADPGRGYASVEPPRRARVQSGSQRRSLGKAETEEGRMNKPGSVRFYLLSGGLGGTVGATGCGSLLTPAAIGISRQSNE